MESGPLRRGNVKGASSSVEIDPLFVTPSMGGEAYALWVRRAVARGRAEGNKLIPLFDSSVEEPVELLRGIVEDAFRPPITSKYQSVFAGGNPYVVDAIAKRYGVTGAHVLPTTGATTGLSLIYRSYIRPGDRVLVETPGFDVFRDIGESLGAHVDTFSRTGADYDVDEFEIARKIQPRTRLIVLSDLHNPSGVLLAGETIARIARMANDRGVKLVVDEVYGDYAPAHLRPSTAAHLSPNIIAVSSLTKIYGLSTLRCGWIIAQEPLLNPIRHLSDRLEFGISKLAHAVAALVLENRARFDHYSEAILAEARPILERYFVRWQAAGLVDGRLPDHGCILFPRLNGIADTINFSEWVANKCGVIVAPGEFFGAAGHIRIGFAHAPDILEFGLSRLSEALEDYASRAAAHSAHA
jgi:aspartate/methionine/tyrosine aminotransferase